jgi:hypothetical protein
MIGSTKIAVVVADQEDWGTFCGDAKKITISTKALEEGLFLTTLMHEMIHAVFFVSGITWVLEQNMEEAVVRAIENMYFPAVASLKLKESRKRKA